MPLYKYSAFPQKKQSSGFKFSSMVQPAHSVCLQLQVRLRGSETPKRHVGMAGAVEGADVVVTVVVDKGNVVVMLVEDVEVGKAVTVLDVIVVVVDAGTTHCRP